MVHNEAVGYQFSILKIDRLITAEVGQYLLYTMYNILPEIV